MRTRLIAAVTATSVGLAFWWGLTEPLPVPPVILLGVPAAILFCAGLIAGRLGANGHAARALRARLGPRVR